LAADNLLTHGDLSLCYRVFGSGKKVMLAFHGFGRTPEDYAFLEPLIGKEYTIYSFPLFQHPGSTYPEERVHRNTLRKEELQAFFRHFLETRQIQRFSLIGFSLGGKVSLCLTGFFADRVDHLLLLAPDGIKINRFYQMVSHNAFFRALYRTIIKHPGGFFGVVKALAQLRLIPEKLKKFVLTHMDSRPKRELVYNVWMTYRSVVPNLTQLEKAIVRHNVQTHLFFGKHDLVIPPRIGTNWLKKTNLPSVQMHVLNCGHRILNAESGQRIQALLGTKN